MKKEAGNYPLKTGRVIAKGCVMKSTVKLVGIIVLTAVIGFSIIACGGGGGSEPTYSAGMFEISTSNFNTMFAGFTYQAPSSSLQFVTGNGAALFAAIKNNENLVIGEIDGDEGLKLSELKSGMAEHEFPDNIVNQIINKLSTDGYVVAYMIAEGTTVGVAAAILE